MSVIFMEDNRIKVGGVLLPGQIKKIEVSLTAAVDDVEVEGLPVNPRQAVGYEDARVKVELILGDMAKVSAKDKVAQINNLFRKKGQEVPQPQSILCEETAAAGIDTVLFEKLTVTKDNKSDIVAVTLEFGEYIPIPITATASTGSAEGATSSKSAAGPMLPDYERYLGGQRGASPFKDYNVTRSPAVDNVAISSKVNAELLGLSYSFS